MRNGKYVVDSIENRLVKLLFVEDEEIEEIVCREQFNHPIKQGDVININIENGKLISMPLKHETETRRVRAVSLIEKLKNKHR